MGQAILVLLIGTLVTAPGLADDGAAEAPTPDVPVEAQVDRSGASVTSEADAPVDATPEADVSAEASRTGVQARTAGQHATVDERGVHTSATSTDVLGSIQVPHLPAGHGTDEIERLLSGEDQAATPPGGHVAFTPSEAATAQPIADAGDAVSQIAPAAALAALAVLHVEPRPMQLRRLLPFTPLAPMFSRISREDVLDHETRAAVYDLLQERPGLSLEAIAAELDRSRSTVRHHVGKLEESGMIAHTARGRCRIHFPVGRQAEAERRHLLSNETRARIAKVTRKRPLTLTELAALLDMNPSAVHFHLGKLVDADVLERVEREDATVYRAR